MVSGKMAHHARGARRAEVYLVRHGETEWNAAGRFQGALDSALTERGIAQANGIGRRLAALGIVPDRFEASPLGRARDSAAIIAAYIGRTPVAQEAALAEISLGSWDGLTAVDIDHGYPEQMAGATPHDWYFRSPDGEDYDRALARAEAWLGETRGIVLAVSHGLFSRILRGAYLCLAREAALALPVPQDVIWRFVDGRIEAIGING